MFLWIRCVAQCCDFGLSVMNLVGGVKEGKGEGEDWLLGWLLTSFASPLPLFPFFWAQIIRCVLREKPDAWKVKPRWFQSQKVLTGEGSMVLSLGPGCYFTCRFVYRYYLRCSYPKVFPTLCSDTCPMGLCFGCC